MSMETTDPAQLDIGCIHSHVRAQLTQTRHCQYIDLTVQAGFVLLLIPDDRGSVSYWVSRLKCEVSGWL